MSMVYENRKTQSNSFNIMGNRARALYETEGTLKLVGNLKFAESLGKTLTGYDMPKFNDGKSNTLTLEGTEQKLRSP